MRVSKLFMPTMREIPADAEAISHQLMLRAGLVRRVASGIYSVLPLGYRVLHRIEQIMREEMNAVEAQELLMPTLLPAELTRTSGRWELFGQQMFRLKDRSEREFCLGPTHEEAFAELVKNEIRSYKNLPLLLYQIQTKFRDERRPRYGAMRAREFMMKDAYSFDRDAVGLAQSYKKVYQAYKRIFERIGLKHKVIDADTGAMGGSGSQEFVVPSQMGETVFAYCDVCGYAANEDKAGIRAPEAQLHKELLPVEKIATPESRTIEELTSFFGLGAERLAKTLLYRADDSYVAAMVRGDRELNETKLRNYLGCETLQMADEESVRQITTAEVGFAGPMGLSIRIVADLELEQMENLIAGANETGYHLINVNPKRDFKADFIDIRKIVLGDSCPECGSPVLLGRGIEIAHIFKLGTKYTAALNCFYQDEAGVEHPMYMGSYGIGLNRIMAAIIEQSHDENGIIWPLSVAPYQVVIAVINVLDEKQMEAAEYLYKSLQAQGVEVLLDDRNERAGVKFKDADLIGIPIRINVGKKATEGFVEYKERHSSENLQVTADEALQLVLKSINNRL